MKRYFLKSIFIVFFAGLVSCDDAIEIVQDGQPTEEVLVRNTADMQLYLNGIYAGVNVESANAFTAIFTDETSVGVGTGGQNSDTHRFQINQSNAFAQTIWYNNYQIINRCNRLITLASNIAVPVDPAELVLYKSVIAQAKVLRAFSYFQLLSYYSPDMSNDNALGVMLFTHVPEVSEVFSRSSVGSVAAQIEADLNSAYADLPNSLSYFHTSPAAVDAIRARFYLQRKNYTLAAQYAQAAITNSGLALTPSNTIPAGLTDADLGIVAPATTPNPRHNAFSGFSSTNLYRRMFIDAARGEIIFGLERPVAGGWVNYYGNFAFNTTNAQGGLMFEVGRNLFNDLVAQTDDIRKFNMIDPTSKIDPGYLTNVNYLQSDVLAMDKFPGKPSGAAMRNNAKVFRISEMYLILAECKARTGDLAGATDDIEAIRNARKYQGAAYSIPDFANLNAALTAILLERKLELAFEGHRYLDLKRLGAEVGLSIDRNITDDNLTNLPLTIPSNSYLYTLPIPQDEINANPGIQQNPGY